MAASSYIALLITRAGTNHWYHPVRESRLCFCLSRADCTVQLVSLPECGVQTAAQPDQIAYSVTSFEHRYHSLVALVGKKPPASVGRYKRLGFNPCVRKIPWRMAWQPTPVFLPGESQGQNKQAGYSP